MSGSRIVLLSQRGGDNESTGGTAEMREGTQGPKHIIGGSNGIKRERGFSRFLL